MFVETYTFASRIITINTFRLPVIAETRSRSTGSGAHRTLLAETAAVTLAGVYRF